jgi:hypothetical protein
MTHSLPAVARHSWPVPGGRERSCVLSLATADDRYPRQLARLKGSVQAAAFAGELMVWEPGAFPDACPPHLDVPFAFKPFCFADARARGVDLALWLDASCVVMAPLDPLFAQIREHGYLLFRNGRHKVGEWASDAALARLGVTRAEAMQMPEANASAVGLDLHHPQAVEFLDRWLEEAQHGVAFRGTEEPLTGEADYLDIKWNHHGRASGAPGVRGHRHDQTVASVLAHHLGMTLTPAGLETSKMGGLAATPGTVIVNDRDMAGSSISRALLARARRSRSMAPMVRALGRLWPGAWR